MLIQLEGGTPAEVRALKYYGWLAVTPCWRGDPVEWGRYRLTHIRIGAVIARFSQYRDACAAALELSELPDPVELSCARDDKRWQRCAVEINSITGKHGGTGQKTPKKRKSCVVGLVSGDWSLERIAKDWLEDNGMILQN